MQKIYALMRLNRKTFFSCYTSNKFGFESFSYYAAPVNDCNALKHPNAILNINYT